MLPYLMLFVYQYGNSGIDPQPILLVLSPRGWQNEDPEPRVGGGVWPKAEKKIVTSLILMAEVVVDMPKGTSDGSPGVQDVLKSL